MNIDRHNYEECFVLYWDNELTAEQRRLVEVFVQQNTDLQEEFRLFGETRFVPEESVLFKNKDLLTIEEHAFINLSNYNELLLSYIDNELTAEQRVVVEKFAAEHSSAQQELAILQKTKLQPETEITFPDKSLLYRREEKVRVIRMIWFRVAVAAAIILVAGFVAFRLIDSGKSGNTELPVAEVKQNEKQGAPENAPSGSTNNKQEQEIVSAPEQKVEAAASQENITSGDKSVAATKEKQSNPVQQKQENNRSLLANVNLPEVNNDPQTNLPLINKGTNDAVAKTKLEETNDIFSDNDVTSRANPSYVVYNPGSDKEAQSDKGGLRGFLRKTTRIFERRTKIQTTTDDNKLLVGVFAVSLK